MKLVGPLHTVEDLGTFGSDAVTRGIPEMFQMTQEPLFFPDRKFHPRLLRKRAQRVYHPAPVTVIAFSRLDVSPDRLKHFRYISLRVDLRLERRVGESKLVSGG